MPCSRCSARASRGLLALREAHGGRLAMRVSLDHYSKALHEDERGAGTFDRTIDGIDWLAANGFALALAGRTCWGESEAEARAGYARLIAERGWPIDAHDPAQLVLFPEMDEQRRGAGDHHCLLGHLGQEPGRRDVRVEPHGGEAQRRRAARGAALHAAPLRPRLRDGGDASPRRRASTAACSTAARSSSAIRIAPSSACSAAAPARPEARAAPNPA